MTVSLLPPAQGRALEFGHFVQTAAWRDGVRRRRAEPVARGWRAFCAYPGNRAQPKTVFAPQRGAETSVSCNLLLSRMSSMPSKKRLFVYLLGLRTPLGCERQH